MGLKPEQKELLKEIYNKDKALFFQCQSNYCESNSTIEEICGPGFLDITEENWKTSLKAFLDLDSEFRWKILQEFEQEQGAAAAFPDVSESEEVSAKDLVSLLQSFNIDPDQLGEGQEPDMKQKLSMIPQNMLNGLPKDQQRVLKLIQGGAKVVGTLQAVGGVVHGLTQYASKTVKEEVPEIAVTLLQQFEKLVIKAGTKLTNATAGLSEKHQIFLDAVNNKFGNDNAVGIKRFLKNNLDFDVSAIQTMLLEDVFQDAGGLLGTLQNNVGEQFYQVQQ